MTDTAYAISSYPDVPAIMTRCRDLVAQPTRPLRRNRMRQVLDYFDTRCGGSRTMTETAKQFIPGGVQHNLAFNYPFPLAMAKSDGAYLWDVDGNRYIDFLQAGGATLLGSNYRPVQERVIDIIRGCGPVTGLFHEFEMKLARLISRHMPAVEMFRMLGSGTEGVMAAIRAARCYTGKQRIIKIGGAYHGWSDQMVYGLHIPGTGAFEAHGIPADCLAATDEAYPNAIDALERLLERNREDGGTAAVIVEPLGPESATRPVLSDTNRQIRDLCDRFETLLIFDEVVTGFRVGLGGAQGYFNIRPDLTVFGKCVAGGYPAAGGLGGRRDVMATLAAGLESGKPRAYVGGTLAANPLSCVAGYYAIKAIEETRAHVKAGRAGDLLCKGLQRLIDHYDLPYAAYNFGSICHLQTSGVMLMEVTDPNIFAEIGPRKHMMEEMGAAFAAEGIISLAGSRLYTSMADTDEVIAEALVGFEHVFQGIEGVSSND